MNKSSATKLPPWLDRKGTKLPSREERKTRRKDYPPMRDLQWMESTIPPGASRAVLAKGLRVLMRKMRRYACLSQRDLAARLDANSDAVVSMHEGKKAKGIVPSFHVLTRWADACGLIIRIVIVPKPGREVRKIDEKEGADIR